jgi:hypothetical protein
MNKVMSKSELIQKIADQHADGMTRKDVKAVIESVAEIGQGTEENGGVPCTWAREVCCDQEASHEGAPGHQPVH